MPADIVSGWFYQTPAWHRLGTVDSKRRSPREAFRIAGADFSIEREAIYDLYGQEIPDFVRLITDDGTHITVRPQSYEVIQNESLIQLAEALGDRVLMDAVVVLQDKKKVSFTADIPNLHGQVVEGDEVRMRLVAMTGHDGTLSYKVIFSPIRVVCSNTMAAAIGIADNNDSVLLSITHKRNAQQLIDHLPKVMDLANRRFTGGLQELQVMARKQIKAAQLDELMTLTFAEELARPINEERGNPDTARPRVLTDLACYDTVKRYFDGEGIGLDMPGVRGSLYAAEQALAQFYTHDAGRAKDRKKAAASRYQSLQSGPAAAILDRAHRIGLQMTKA